jgi:hypothetical protein
MMFTWNGCVFSQVLEGERPQAVKQMANELAVL